MAIIAADMSMLLLVDFQTRLMPAIHDGARLVANAVRLCEAARLLSVPILRTEQYPKGLGGTVSPLDQQGQVIEKLSFGACDEPDFVAATAGHPALVVTGCESHVCVLQTVLGLLARGQRVHVVQDAVGSRSAESKEVAMARMRAHGADIVTTEMVVFEWLRRADHPAFRTASALIK